jgi:hypothetical protein
MGSYIATHSHLTSYKQKIGGLVEFRGKGENKVRTEAQRKTQRETQRKGRGDRDMFCFGLRGVFVTQG